MCIRDRHFITISKSDGAKTKTAMYKMDINVQYVNNKEHFPGDILDT